MSSPASIRLANLADSPALTEVRRCAILELAAATLGKSEARRWADSAAEDRVARAIEQHEVWLLEQAGSARGWVEIERDRIEGLYVHPAGARLGIGSLLVAHAESRIEMSGHTRAMLDASANAEAFYLDRGYRIRGAALPDGSIPMDKLLGE